MVVCLLARCTLSVFEHERAVFYVVESIFFPFKGISFISVMFISFQSEFPCMGKSSVRN